MDWRAFEAIVGESNIGGASERNRAGIGSVVAGCALDFVSKLDVRIGSKADLKRPALFAPL